jgi:hypothetical protein
MIKAPLVTERASDGAEQATPTIVKVKALIRQPTGKRDRCLMLSFEGKGRILFKFASMARRIYAWNRTLWLRSSSSGGLRPLERCRRIHINGRTVQLGLLVSRPSLRKRLNRPIGSIFIARYFFAPILPHERDNLSHNLARIKWRTPFVKNVEDYFTVTFPMGNSRRETIITPAAPRMKQPISSKTAILTAFIFLYGSLACVPISAISPSPFGKLAGFGAVVLVFLSMRYSFLRAPTVEDFPTRRLLRVCRTTTTSSSNSLTRTPTPP